MSSLHGGVEVRTVAYNHGGMSAVEWQQEKAGSNYGPYFLIKPQHIIQALSHPVPCIVLYLSRLRLKYEQLMYSKHFL